MIDKFSNFLEEHDFLPLSSWNEFIADHTQHQEGGAREHIREQAYGTPGVYIYYHGDECLYVGMAKNLSGRMLNHQGEAFVIQKNGRNNKQFPFFAAHRYPLKVLWKQVDDVYDRIAIEAMLTRVLKPKYIDFLEGKITL